MKSLARYNFIYILDATNIWRTEKPEWLKSSGSCITEQGVLYTSMQEKRSFNAIAGCIFYRTNVGLWIVPYCDFVKIMRDRYLCV